MTNLVPFFKTTSWLTRPTQDFLGRFFEDFDWPMMGTSETEWMPEIDVSETDSEFIVKAEVPGLAKDDIGITLSNGLLTLSGEKKHESEEKKENYHLMERRYGAFRRSVRLPDTVKPEEINALYKDGVLTVTVPKPRAEQPKKIEIKN